MVKPTEILMAEHRGISAMLGATKGATERMLRGEAVELQVFADMLDFYANFADRCHHGKEEKLLFPRLEQRGIPAEGGPIGVMLAEHEEGRGHIRGMRKALADAKGGDRLAVQALIEHALAYVELLQRHIGKEDRILFAMADQVLSRADNEELEEAFERVEREEMGDGVHESYHRMIQGFAARFAV